MRGRIRRLGAVTLLALPGAGALLLTGCGSEPNTPYSLEPSLYLLLVPAAEISPDTGLHALLITTGEPNHSPYRDAQLFEMTRRSDGARFNWVSRGLSGRAPIGFEGSERGSGAQIGNYHLPWDGAAGSLGARDLTGGEWYDLLVETEGVTIRGAALLPAEISATVSERGDSLVISWSKSAGAVVYQIWAAVVWTPDGHDGYSIVTRDTVVVVPRTSSAKAEIMARDENLHRFIVDWRAARAGIDAGYGYFGGMSRTEVLLPPSP